MYTMWIFSGVKWVLAVLLMVCYQDLPSAQIRHDKLFELKAIMANEKKVFQHLPFLASYPDQPSGLPATIIAHAYGDEPSVSKDFPGIQAIAASVPLRSNNKMMKQTDKRAIKQDFDALKQYLQTTGCSTGVAQNDSSNASPPHSSNASPPQSSNASPPHSSSFGCWAELINSQDPDELELLAEFHRKLTELRRSKSGGASIIDAPGQAQQTNEPSKAQGLVLTPGVGGKWSLQPKLGPKPEPKVEPKTEHMGVKSEHLEAPQPDALHDSDSDALDAHSKAALKSMKTRNAGKTKKRPASAIDSKTTPSAEGAKKKNGQAGCATTRNQSFHAKEGCLWLHSPCEVQRECDLLCSQSQMLEGPCAWGQIL